MNMIHASIFLTLLACFAKGEHVAEVHADYQCPEGSPQYDEVTAGGIQCEQLWTHNGRNFAVYSDDEEECNKPCVSVHAGGVRLNTCVNITLTLLCKSQFLTESRIHFTGRVGNGTGLPHQKWKRSHCIGLVVVAVILVGVIILLFLWRKLSGQSPGIPDGE